MSTSQPGAGMGAHIARIVAESIIGASATTSDHKEHARIRANSAFMEQAEQVYGPILKEVFGGLLEQENLPPGWRTFIESMTEPSHQFNVILQIIGAIGAAVTGIFVLGGVELQQVKNSLLQTYPDVPISPGDTIDMALRGTWDLADAQTEASLSGLSNVRFDQLLQNAGDVYPNDVTLDLWRRGLIDSAAARLRFAMARLNPLYEDDMFLAAYQTMQIGDAIEGAPWVRKVRILDGQDALMVENGESGQVMPKGWQTFLIIQLELWFTAADLA